jgi:RNA polymerase sigma-70 factor, ECF subfamily
MHATTIVPTPVATARPQARPESWEEGGGQVGGDADAGLTGGGPDDRGPFSDSDGGTGSRDGAWDVISSTGPFLLNRGKPRAMTPEQLFAESYPKLAGWVRRLVDDDDTAHEIASEAFVRLLSRWTKPSNLESPQSYLYMIATNLVRDHWRKLERERRAMRAVTSGSELEPTSDPAQDVDVRELIAGLPARLREPFLLHYYAGFGVREIAVLLKRPEGTIKADLYHARAKLRESLGARGVSRPAGAEAVKARQAKTGQPKGGKARDAR